VARRAGPVLIRFFFSGGAPQGYALSKWLRTKIHRLISLQVVLARVLGAVATRAARHRSPRSRARPRAERRGLGGGQSARADKMREEQAKARRASEAASREAALPDARRDRRAGDLTLTDLNLEDEQGRASPRALRPARLGRVAERAPDRGAAAAAAAAAVGDGRVPSEGTRGAGAGLTQGAWSIVYPGLQDRMAQRGGARSQAARAAEAARQRQQTLMNAIDATDYREES